MLAVAGLMALLLGVTGIYGVISYSVTQRVREIGIRIALGAQRGQILGMFVRDGLILTSTGVACGLVAAFAVMRLMQSLLFGVSPLDPLTYVAMTWEFLPRRALLSGCLRAGLRLSILFMRCGRSEAKAEQQGRERRRLESAGRLMAYIRVQ